MSRFLIGLGGLLIATGALVIAVVDEVTYRLVPERYEPLLRLVCVTVACMVGAAWWAKRESAKASIRRPPERGNVRGPQLSSDEIRAAAQEMVKRYGVAAYGDGDHRATAIESFVELLITGRAYASSAIEEVQIRGDDLVTTVSLEIGDDVFRSLEQGWVPLRLVPILTRKETLADVEASGPAGNVRVLASLETQGLLYLTIRLLFRLSLVHEGRAGDLGPEQEPALEELVSIVCRPDRVSDADFEEAYDLATQDLHLHNGRQLRSICRFFARNYITLVEVPTRDNGAASVRYTTTLPASERLTGWNDKTRTVVGLRPFRYVIPLYWPFYAKNYQLSITGQDGQFVYRHYLEDLRQGRRFEVSSVGRAGNPRTYLHLQTNTASPRTSVHTRDFHLLRPVEIGCVVEFEEIPPGALGRVVAISAVSSALILTFAFSLPQAGESVTGIDFAALLLAFPLFAATWVGQSAERVRQSSLTTYGGLAVSAIVSLSSAVLYVVQTLTPEFTHVWHVHVLGLFALPRFDLLWGVLGFLSCAGTVYLAGKAKHRMKRYVRTLRRRGRAWGPAYGSSEL